MNYIELFSMIRNYNYYRQFNKSKKLYEDYNYLIPKDNVYLKNKFLNEYEIACKKTLLESKPRNLQIVLFDNCNSNCIMCTQKNKKYNYYLPEEYIYELFFLLPYLDTIMWQGGEVFLWDDFISLIKSISSYKQITQSIITNFQTVTEDQIKYLASINNLKLIISIDGSKKEIYEKIRLGSSFDKLVKNIKILNKYRTKYKSNMTTHINFVVMKENYNDIVDILSFAKDNKFKSVAYVKCVETESYSNKIDSKDYSDINNLLNFATIKAVKNDIQINVEYPSLIFNKMQNLSIKNKTLICKIPWYKLLLAEDFSFAPECSCFKRFDYYDKNISIEQMWNSELMQDYRKHILGIKNNIRICNSKCLYYASQYLEGMSINN